MILDGAALRKHIEETFDAVIIGSGAGGAVLAKELAEGGMKVAIVEEGAHHKVASHTDLPYEALTRLYRDKGFTSTLGKPAIPVPMGRALGGTTVINSGTCFRTPTNIFKHWNDDLGLYDLTEESFGPIFERVEKEINVSVASFDVMSKANIIFHELMQKQGFHGAPLRRNIKDCDGCGFCCYGCPKGAKQSMDVSYIPRAIGFGAKVFTNAKVDSIIIEGKRATGIVAKFQTPEGRATGFKLTIHARTVVIAAGTIPTPQLMQKNGIARQNKNLGRHLTLHPATKVFARFEQEVRGWEGTPQAYYSDQLKEHGITFEGIFVPPDVAAMTVPFVGRRLNEFMREYKHMAAFGFMINDSSTGRVMNLPLIGPTILYNMQPEDVEKVRKGVAFLARTFLQGGALNVYTMLHGYTELSSEADVQRLENGVLRAEDVDCMAFHPLGTCRMGRSATTGVVGTDYKVFGYDGLYICDGSVVPTSLGVNPQITIMAFATRFAFQLLGKKLTHHKPAESPNPTSTHSMHSSF